MGSPFPFTLTPPFPRSMPFYTHFTSPIRRMADVVVHRVLAATLGGEPQTYTPQSVQDQALICNERKMAAKKAQEAHSDLYMCVFIQENGPLIEEATVMKVQDRSFDVLVERLGIDERVLLDNMDGLLEYKFYDASRTCELYWSADAAGSDEASMETIEMFSKVKVKLTTRKSGYVRGS